MRSVFFLLGALTLPGGTLAAQEADFLFKTPRVTFGVFGGYAMASAGSGIFDLTEEQLTVDRSDFDSGLLGAQLGVAVGDRFEISLRGELARTETRSEYRDWVDIDDRPIEQTTTLRRTPATASLKYYLRDRGQAIGRFAWIPADWAPYVGVGGGWTFYRFEQEGDWIDFEDPDLPIRFDSFLSDGTAPTFQLLAGADLSLGRTWFATGEARYAWASAAMDRQFVDFDNIDLGGFLLTVGFSARF